MNNSKKISVLCLFFALLFFICIAGGPAICGDELDTLHKGSLVWDCHNDLVYGYSPVERRACRCANGRTFHTEFFVSG